VHLSLFVVEVFSEFFAVFLREQSQQVLNGDAALQLDFVHFLAGYLSQRSEKFDFDFHLCSVSVFFGAEFILFYAAILHYEKMREGQTGFGSIKLK
jgi:hypothetical protein